MSSKLVHVAFCCDGSYLQPLVVAVQSVLESAHDPRGLHLWLVSEDFPSDGVRMIERLTTAAGAGFTYQALGDGSRLLEGAPLRLHGHISIAAYYRLFLPELLPVEVDRLVYLDSDLVVGRAIEELAAVDLEGTPLAAVMKPRAAEYRDVGLAAETDYFNSGVLVIDTARWREENLRHVALHYARAHPDARHGHDQPALNHACRGSWKRLDLRWNQQFKFFVHTAGYLRMTRAELRAVRRVHYTTCSKPWHFSNDHPWRGRYFEVLDRTPFAGWRPQPTFSGERYRRALTAWVPHTLRPGVLRNVGRPYFRALKEFAGWRSPNRFATR